jgi:toxin HigB-1
LAQTPKNTQPNTNGTGKRSFSFSDSVIRNISLDTEALFHSQTVPKFRNIERVARRKLLQLHAANELASLRVPPGNQIEALKGSRKGQHSIRVNDQWRVCFV